MPRPVRPLPAPSTVSSHRLRGAVGVLVGLDAVGGTVAVVDGVNSPADAWGSRALLAAPWPMIAAQVLLTVVATRARPGPARAAATALGLACLVSAASGFFDGGLAAEGLAPRHRALQVVLVVWTALAGVLAVGHALRVSRADPGRPAGASSSRRR